MHGTLDRFALLTWRISKSTEQDDNSGFDFWNICVPLSSLDVCHMEDAQPSMMEFESEDGRGDHVE